MPNEVASMLFPFLGTVSIFVASTVYVALTFSLCVRSGRSTAAKKARKTKSALSPGTITKSAVTGKTTASSKPTTTSTTKPTVPIKSIDTSKPPHPNGTATKNGTAATTTAGSKDPAASKPSTSNEKAKDGAAPKGKSLMKAPTPPLQEQPTQRPTVKEVKPAPKQGKTAEHGEKGAKNQSHNKSLRVEQTQMGSIKKMSGSDDCTEKCGTPELVLDRTQRSISVKVADDEDTNENIDELPMDEHLSE